jgi:hypothetical protein
VSATHPTTFTRLDLSREAEPHVVVLSERVSGDRYVITEVVGPFPDEATALGFIEEHDLGGLGDQVALIAPLTSALTYAARSA